MINTETIILSSFSCLGKTYLGNKNKDILDLEASWYKWIYQDKELEKDVEKRKGVYDRSLNPKYPQNYLKALEENIGKYKMILITPEKRIREILKEKGISYYLAYPVEPGFVSQRAIERGNNLNFAEGLKKSFKTWYPEKEEKVLWVKKNEYLEDVIKEIID